ncbi:MAG: hypothetical protein E7012_03480 [Alphaproteobacteria bacterium]|nr:hypothetical protein [Alphaproteobacteria bacterium]
MFTWIIIAIAIATIFGVINLKNIKSQSIEFWNKFLPIAQKTISETKSKAQNQLEKVKKKDKE